MIIVSASKCREAARVYSHLYLQVRDGSTPAINAISFLLILGTSSIALVIFYSSRGPEGR